MPIVTRAVTSVVTSSSSVPDVASEVVIGNNDQEPITLSSDSELEDTADTGELTLTYFPLPPPILAAGTPVLFEVGWKFCAA